MQMKTQVADTNKFIKTLLCSKFTLLSAVGLAAALGVHFIPSPQERELRETTTRTVASPDGFDRTTNVAEFEADESQADQLSVNDPNQPQVIEIRQDPQSDLATVTVEVPPGITQVTLQSLDGAQEWVTRAVAHAGGLGTNLTFHAPAGVNPEHLRVVGEAHGGPDTPAADTHEPVRAPADAQTKFARFSATQPPAPGGNRGPMAGALNAGATEVGGGQTTTPRAVTESDIWKIRGQTLYFFNQLRGLQIIDISNPDGPIRLGKLALPAVGEDMYILDDSHVILLARKGSRWDQSEIIAVRISEGTPSITARLDVDGTISTSRLVGTALYVAADSYQTIITDPLSETIGGVVAYVYGTQLAAFDFSNPESPAARNTLWFDGWNSNAVLATDRFFFIASTTDYLNSAIHFVDISSPDGTMVAKGTIQAAGSVADKFKMGLNGDVFTAISQVWDWTDEETQNISKLETFSLADPNTPVALGELSIGAGEQLYATRVEAGRAYVVTAEQIDPLWIIDLSDPANPGVTGELEAPGFSTYIQPLGSQLVTIGIVDNHVAVSLFDVQNPAAPVLLSRVAAGGSNSWSEAVWNEKAFSVLPEAGLILVPNSGWNSESGFASQVQLIDLGATSLTLRGVINQPFEPRRATVFENRILSISSHELLTVNAADRDRPAVTSDVALAWAVDRVFVQGNYLIEVENGNTWTNGAPTLRVALASDPDQVESETNLAAAPIVGATTRDGQLYLAQCEVQTSESDEPTSTLIVSSYDLTQLPQLLLRGQTQTAVEAVDAGASLDGLWPNPGVLVWAAGGNNSGPIYSPMPVIMDVGLVSGGTPILSTSAAVNPGRATGTSGAVLGSVSATTVNGGVTGPDSFPITDGGRPGDFWWWGGSTQGRLFAFDVAVAGPPVFLSDTTFASDAWSTGAAFTADSVVYASHAGALEVNGTAAQDWAEGWFLDVIDFTNPAAPVVRAPVSIPTKLIGVNNATRQSATLFTLGGHVWDETNPGESLDASTYDGVSVTLLDTVSLADWSNPAVSDGATIFIGKATDDSRGAIETWTLSGDNRLTLLGSVAVASPPWNVRAFGDLLAAQTDGQILLFDKSDSLSLRQIGSSESNWAFFGLNLNTAAGEMTRGLWVPLGDYGVLLIAVDLD
jgi:hypothetical protein